jgi:hypothetical protein
MHYKNRYCWCALLLLGCEGGRGITDSSDTEVAEGENDGATFEVTLELSENIRSVVTATWDVELEQIDSASIEFGPDDSYGLTAPVKVGDSRPYKTLLLGMKGEREYHCRITAKSGDQIYQSDDYTISTGPVPGALPSLTIDNPDPAKSWNGYLLTSTIVSPPAAVILDADGDYVWWYKPEGFSLLSRAHFSLDGTAIWMHDVNMNLGMGGGSEDHQVLKVSLDGSQVEKFDLPYGHHDFLELPDQTLAYIAYDPQMSNGTPVAGDRLMERKPDGTIKEIYNIWDDYEYDYTTEMVPGTMWPHANAVDYLPDEDAYLLSFLYLNAIFKIDRQTGDVLWILGGNDSDFVLPDQSTEFFDHQHQMHMIDGSLLVFVNGTMPFGTSRAVEYSLNEQTFEAELNWEYKSSPPLISMALGDASRLESGNALVTYSYSGQIHEVDESGEVVWKLSAAAGGAVGYTTQLESLYVE